MDPGGEVHELWVGDDGVRIERIDVLVQRFVRLLRRCSHLLIDLILLSSRGGLLVEFLLWLVLLFIWESLATGTA